MLSHVGTWLTGGWDSELDIQGGEWSFFEKGESLSRILGKVCKVDPIVKCFLKEYYMFYGILF